MSSDKKPDNVVYNPINNTYDAALKPYATNVGAPAIMATDNITWKNKNINKANKQIGARYIELKTEHEKLMKAL